MKCDTYTECKLYSECNGHDFLTENGTERYFESHCLSCTISNAKEKAVEDFKKELAEEIEEITKTVIYDGDTEYLKIVASVRLQTFYKVLSLINPPPLHTQENV